MLRDECMKEPVSGKDNDLVHCDAFRRALSLLGLPPALVPEVEEVCFLSSRDQRGDGDLIPWNILTFNCRKLNISECIETESDNTESSVLKNYTWLRYNRPLSMTFMMSHHQKDEMIDSRKRHTTEIEETSEVKRFKRELQEVDPVSEQPWREPIPTSKTQPLPTTLDANAGCSSGKQQLSRAVWRKCDFVDFWCRNSQWPGILFEAGRRPGQTENMHYLLAKKKSSPSLCHRLSSPSLATSYDTSTDQESSEGKNAKYKSPTYTTVLAAKGSFMREHEKGVTDASKRICKVLLERKQPVPVNTLFEDTTFQEFCQRLYGKNEQRIIQDIGRLIVPSAESLQLGGAKGIEHLVESVNERWSSSIPFYGPVPQPDYSVGFDRSVFTNSQLESLKPFLGPNLACYSSLFMATYYMYFPFLTCEVKGVATLEIADRQNAHSMTIAVRAVVELFRLVGREEEINREILAYSIAHDHRSVSIYGHYAVIQDSTTSYYRHLVHDFVLAALDGKERWTAFKFVKNVYEIWAPVHLKRICSAIDELPDKVDFSVVEQSDL